MSVDAHAQKRLGYAILCVMVALFLLAQAEPADAKKNHLSSVHSNNGCPWYGSHDWGTGYAKAITSHNDGTGLFCTEMQVKLRVNGWTYVDNDSDWASILVSANIYSFEWSDHNADPNGSPPWVGFRMY